MLESNLLFAIIASVSHTITLNQKSGCSFWTYESWLDTKYEWIDVSELYFVTTPVNTVHTHVNSESLRRWVLGIHTLKFFVADMLATDDNLISIFVGESDFDLTASSWTWWALELFTNQFEFGSVGIFGDTKFGIAIGDSCTSLKHKVPANILPIYIILLHFNDGFTSVVGWRCWTHVFNVRNLRHVSLFDYHWTLWISVSTFVINILGSTVVVLELIPQHTSQVNISVTRCFCTVWQNIFYQDWLEEFECVWPISEV